MRQSAAVLGVCFVFAMVLGAEAHPIGPSEAHASPNPVLAAADEAWRRRDEGRAGARANRRRISEAVSRYEEAAAVPEAAEARWKLARALFFEAKFTGLDRKGQRALLEKARKAGEEGIALLQRRGSLSRDPDAAATYFWAAVAWGEWAQIVPRARAARARAASRIRDYASTVIRLDPRFEDGGGYRILGRLHHLAPRIPIVTGWVSRAEGIRNLRLAVKTAPENFVNRHFLAEALAEGGPAAKSEAIRIEEQLIADPPSPDHLVEDIAIQEEAKKDLVAWGGGTARP
jgi:tetratricopeptide (TPR) repeat protein